MLQQRLIIERVVEVEVEAEVEVEVPKKIIRKGRVDIDVRHGIPRNIEQDAIEF